MIFCHYTNPQAAQVIKRDGAIRPYGYGDVLRCHTMRHRYWKIGDAPCDHDHPHTPPVTWLMEHGAHFPPSWSHGHVALVRYTVEADAQRWHDFARHHGADESWLADKPTLVDAPGYAHPEQLEWVTTEPIPRGQWLDVEWLPVRPLPARRL